MCAEIEGASAFGFVRRGFQSVVDPPMDMILRESACDSCGLCLSTCPTGALEYRPRLPKPGPWLPKETETVCTLCGMGCQIIAKTKAGHCLEVMPRLNGSINQGKLCWRGTFGWEMIHSSKRPVNPLIRKANKMVDISWDRAFKEAGKTLKGLIADYGSQSIAILASPRLLIEETFLIKNVAKGLGTEEFYKPGRDPDFDYLSPDEKRANYQTLLESDMVLCLGSRLVEDYPVASYMIKDVVKKGGRLAVIGIESRRLTDIADIWMDCPQKEQKAILSLLSALAVDQGTIRMAHHHKMEKIKSISSTDLDILNRSTRKGDAKDLARYLFDAKRPVIVVNKGMVSDATLAWLFEGIWNESLRFLSLSPYGRDCGDNAYLFMDRLEKTIKDGKIKGILAFGHWKGLERIRQAYPHLLIVQSAVFIENHGYQPDFFLPLSLPLETNGSFINSEGQIRSLLAAVPPRSGLQTREIIMNLAEKAGISLPYKGLEEIYRAVECVLNMPQKEGGAEDWPFKSAPANTKKELREKEGTEWSTDEIDLFLKEEISVRIFKKGEG
jgi:formate dehydrogenase major subunit